MAGMRCFRLGVGLLVAAVWAAGCQRTVVELATPGSTAAEPERQAVVREVEGVVEARPAANWPWAAAAEGMRLAQAAQVRTGADGRAMISLTEGSKIRLGPDTIFTFTILNAYLDSLLTSLKLEKGRVWIMLNGGALDVETALGTASAREAYMSVRLDARSRTLDIDCLQGQCYFGGVFIPAHYKLEHAERNTAPVPMELADYGAWGVNVAEATHLAALATEAVAQGTATMPVVGSPTPTPVEPVTTPVTPLPTLPLPTVSYPSSTPPAFTPIPPAPIIGWHKVLAGETLFCIARSYGVLPAAIAQANGLSAPFTVYPDQTLKIPKVQWKEILPGPVCVPQFQSPFPGLPPATSTPEMAAATSTPAAPPLRLEYGTLCIARCGESEGDYIVRFTLTASGGVEPYTYSPAQTFDLTFPHCVDQSGTVSVTSADGQTVSLDWFYHDVSCP